LAANQSCEVLAVELEAFGAFCANQSEVGVILYGLPVLYSRWCMKRGWLTRAWMVIAVPWAALWLGSAYFLYQQEASRWGDWFERNAPHPKPMDLQGVYLSLVAGLVPLAFPWVFGGLWRFVKTGTFRKYPYL